MTTSSIGSLNITSATWGGMDFTSLVQQRLWDYKTSNPNATTWSIPITNEFFLVDPNPNVKKACVIVYFVFLHTPSNPLTRSTFHTTVALEGENIVLSPATTTFEVLSTPVPAASNEFIVAAFWYNKDVTAQVEQALNTPNLVYGTPVAVSETTFGSDPAVGITKQCTIVYGRYVNGKWYYCTAVDLHAENFWTITIPPAIPVVEKRRLEIYSATWGGEDYTEFVRNQYISDSINTPPTSQVNKWSFTPNNDFFGPDPNPNVKKMFVMIYRVARLTGEQQGLLTDPKAPPVWTQAYFDTKPAPLSVPNYPILGAVSGFRSIATQEGLALNIDLANIDLTPLDKPLQDYPWIAKAVYANVDVTETVQHRVSNAVMNFRSPGVSPIMPSTLHMTVSPSEFIIPDPWPDMPKQLTLTAGYPTKDEAGYEMRTFVQLGGGSSFSIELPMDLPIRKPQWPQPWTPPLYNKITFVDHGLAQCWPQVYHQGKKFWCPRPSGLDIFQGNDGPFCMGGLVLSTKVDLIKDAGCKPGEYYQVNFNCLLIEDSPMSTEFCVSADPTREMELTYHIDHKVVETVYYIGRAVQFLGQAFGLLLEAIA